MSKLKFAFLLLLWLTKSATIFAIDTQLVPNDTFSTTISAFDEHAVKRLLQSCEQFILGSDRPLSNVSICGRKSGSENLGIFYIIENSSKKNIFVLKFLGLDLGWLDAHNNTDKQDTESLYLISNTKAHQEIANNKKAVDNLLKISKFTDSIKIILPHKYLRFRYPHSSLTKLTQYVSIMVAADGVLVRDWLEKILNETQSAEREKSLEKLATTVAQRIADFHILTLAHSRESLADKALKHLPKTLLEVRAQLHGDLHAGNLFWDEKKACLTFIDCESFGCFPKMPVFLDVVYFLEATERIFDYTKNLPSLNAFKDAFLSAYFDHISESSLWKTSGLNKTSYRECYFSRQQELKQTIEILRD